MLAIAWYLLKVLLCSGILFGYYWIALRNKKFHLYNRFYLLIAVAISWLIPLMRIDFFFYAEEKPQMISLLTIVSSGNQYVEATADKGWFVWDSSMVILLAFTLISAICLARLVVGLIKIKLLISKSASQKLDDVYFIFSNAKGTPFSFFKYIFWNEKINLDSEDGKHILKHELAHVKEKHSADKLFVGLVFIIGWYNPVMWFIRKELNMIHEFIADEKAIKDGNTAAFASMILNAAYSPHSFAFSNPFFYSPLKRRLIMLTTSKHTRFTYLRRVAILPLLAVTCLLFAFQLKSEKQIDNSSERKAENLEVLNVLKAIENDLIKNDTTIKRKADKTLLRQNMEDVVVVGYSTGSKTAEDLQERVVIGYATKGANTIHDTTIKRNGEVVVTGYPKPKKEDENQQRVVIGYPLKNPLTKPLYVVDGIIMTSQDFENLSLNPQRIKTINVLKGESAVEKFGEKARHGVIEIFTAPESLKLQEVKLDKVQEVKFDKIFTKVENPPAYIGNFSEFIYANLQYPNQEKGKNVEGKVVIRFLVGEDGNLSDFKPLSSIGDGFETEAIRLIKLSGPWKPAMQNGRKVVYEVKQEIDFASNNQAASTITPAQFPGGQKSWKTYLERNLNANVLAENKAPAGNYTVVVKFNVSKTGLISNIFAETNHGYGSEKEAIRIIKSGPKWQPATKDGKSVNSQVTQKVSFMLVDE